MVFNFKLSVTSFAAFLIFIAIDKELDNAKIDGPEPEILHPRAPAEIEDFLISWNPFINFDLIGSIKTSVKDLEIIL